LNSKSKRHYRKEAYDTRRGKNHPRWNGGKKLDQRGYIRISSHNHPFKDVDGYVFEHRLVMEKHLGRYLNTTEHVHHKNENKSDNRLENLELMTQVEHTRRHSEVRRDPITGRYL
jgi:hypothetical protein